ncbi:hypothetical protein LXA43DRAFT_321132 [Ganoderma leucocontextum]|nr:hypothetical protein LXA43DRAFT_321132 [Ganoderma leucocontextum]
MSAATKLCNSLDQYHHICTTVLLGKLLKFKMQSRDLSVNQSALAVQPDSPLNLDVLRTVMAFASVADLKELAVVSLPLREEALREILTRGVHLRRGTARLQSFCHFMLKRDPPLYPFLHTLILEHIPGRASDEFDPNDLLQVLSRATYLRDLRIRWCDHLFTANSALGLPVTLPQLQDLHRLEIWTRQNTTDPLVAKTVLRLRTQLHNLQFSSDADNQLPHDFPNLLAVRQQSIHRLRICYPDLTSIPWAPFTSVRVLFLTIGNKLPSLPHLAQIFPNLRELAVVAVGFEVDFGHPAPEHVKARQDATAFQNSGGGWKSLDVLTTTTIGDPWVLCLACHVRSVRLGNYDVGSHAAFVDVVSRTRPKKVTLHLACAQYCAKPESEPSIFLFPADPSNKAVASLQRVTHAMLPFTISSFWQDQTTSAIVDVIVSHISDSRLEYLHLAFAEFFMASSELDERVLTPRDIHPHSVKVIEDINVDLLVLEVAVAGPHLRVLVLTLATRDQSVWMIGNLSEGVGKRISRVQDPHSAREIIEREERAHLYPN